MNPWIPRLQGNRWWIYQRERFPIFAHGLLIAVFSGSAVCFSRVLRGGGEWPAGPALVTAFVTALGIFLQLRIADEFKDFVEDSRYRAYRPVPRGLIKLKELGWLAAATALIQLGIGGWHSPRLIPLLLVTWTYLALMTREFFVEHWIRERPITYLWTHMLILPLTDLYATACDWVPVSSTPPAGLMWFVAVSFFNGIGLEIGRKIRAPENEEEGVRTYSRLWGGRHATWAWWAALSVTAVSAVAAATQIGSAGMMGGIMAVLLVAAAWLGRRFINRPSQRTARQLDQFSGIWTLITYLSLGIVPLLVRIFHRTP